MMRKSRRGKEVERGLIETASNLTLARRIEFALQAARGIRDLHAAGYSHEDLKPSQFLVSKTGQLKLNDFNRARFITYDRVTQRQCPFYVDNNPGSARSPEEYNYEEETEMVRGLCRVCR